MELAAHSSSGALLLMAAPAGTLEALSRAGLWNLVSAVWLMDTGTARVLLLILLTCGLKPQNVSRSFHSPSSSKSSCITFTVIGIMSDSIRRDSISLHVMSNCECRTQTNTFTSAKRILQCPMTYVTKLAQTELIKQMPIDCTKLLAWSCNV